ncbi:MAG: hypothetical protein ABF887_05750 [Gluconobacter oxydans]|uniref:hypothetical protein n=1 Tax=Gluconobacter oxydans TaxID=442 RepID=UPI0039E82367
MVATPTPAVLDAAPRPRRQAAPTTTLYRIHHPESSVKEARRLVAEWIDHHVVRQARGQTPGCDC